MACLARLALTLLCAPLLLLAGCPDDPLDGTAGAPPHNLAKMTAPAIPQPVAAPQPATAEPAALPAYRPAYQATTAHLSNAANLSLESPSARSGQQVLPQAQTATQQQAQVLINQAENSYNSGVNNYRAGRLDAARLDFDYAIDTMLSSGYDLKSEGPLSDEFDRLVNAINTLELVALKQGNGLSPKTEEAPLEAAENLTFAPNPELAAKLKTELNTTSDLPLVINDDVAGYIGAFSGSESFRKHMAASLQRVGKYRGLIERVLREEGVPQDLIYLAVAESGFQPQALNAHSGAGGMWQFMTYTGPEFGLTRNGYFDYRFDPEKSSRAYARYIKQLYNQFGDWYLAMAAYNWGPGNIQRDVQRTGFADFWEFYRRGLMPAQTRAYVPQILAAILMAKNPERYGLDKLVPSPPVIYDTVSTSYAIDLRLVADVTGSTVQELVALNPALLRLTTPPDIPYDLHIPPGTKDLYVERLKDIPEDRRASWRFHVVKPGETLAGIAAALHAKESDIATTNGITAADPMGVDDELVVPVQSAASSITPQRYTVRAGDTLITVADRFNVSVDELRRWNLLASASLKPGRSLYVAEPIRLAPSGRVRSRGGARAGSRHGSRSSGRGRARSTSSTHAHTAASSAAHGASAKASASKKHAATSSSASKKKTKAGH